MNARRSLSILSVAFAAFLVTDADSEAQRGGRAGGAAGAGRSAAMGRATGPYGGGGAAAHTRGAVMGPGGSSAAAGSARGSYTTAGGSTIKYGAAGAGVAGPNRAAGRGVGGVQVTTPGGQSYTKAGTAGGAVGPQGAIGGKASVGVAQGPAGTAVSASRGGAAVGAGGAVAGGTRAGYVAGARGVTAAGASRHGAVVGPGGAVAGGTRVGAVAGPYGGYAGYVGRGVAVGGWGTRYVGAGTLRAQGAYVRSGWTHYGYFRPAWYARYPGAWRAAAWTGAATAWTAATWATLAALCHYPPQPIIYDYGSTIVYEGDQVYYQGEPIATAPVYAEQATQIVDEGLAANVSDAGEWAPLGVFAAVQDEEKEATNIFQLAINKDGIIRGNYYNGLMDSTEPVSGAVDPKTQRAAWIVGGRKDTVYETGIGNLTQPETTMLVHFGKDRTQQWSLVRLEKPEE